MTETEKLNIDSIIARLLEGSLILIVNFLNYDQKLS